MAPTELLPAPEGLPAATASDARRGWFDVTVRLATSWVGLFTAYAGAVTLALTNVGKLRAGFIELGLPPWGGLALLAALPLLALVFSTIPSFLEQRRIQRYGEIKVDVRAGYFTLRPRETEAEFERVDNAHEQVLRWIENSKEPVLYLTGASGTGKSSLLAAWVIPKLMREGHVVIQLRGYEQLLERIKDRILEPGLIWTQPPGSDADLRLLLERAGQRLGERRLILAIDQFEEFLILKDEEQQRAFQKLISVKTDNLTKTVNLPKTSGGLTFLLVYRPEYEGLIQDQDWPRLKLDTNRKVISAFTENAATEFLRKSGLTLNADLTRAVMREAAEIEQGTTGLIRPVTINLCGLVLSRFSSGLPRRFRGGILRGFLRESLLLPEVRDVAEKIIPTLITDNITKRPRTIAEMAQATGLMPAAIRACMRRLGESDRAIVRPLNEEQETWEISHDFLVSLLDAIVARRTVSLWRRVRPWLPWAAAGIVGVVALVIPRLTKPDPTVELRKQGWTISETKEGLDFKRDTAIPPESIAILRTLPPPFELDLFYADVTEISALQELKGMTALNLGETKVRDISALRELKNLVALDLTATNVSDISPLRDLKGLTKLYLGVTNVVDISALRELKGLTRLHLDQTSVAEISVLRGLKNLRDLDLGGTNVGDISPLRELKNLTKLNLLDTKVANVSALAQLKDLTELELSATTVGDLTPIRELRKPTMLDLESTNVTDISALRQLKGLTTLNLSNTNVADISALRQFKGLTTLNLSNTKVTDISALHELKSLTELKLIRTKVADISPLRGLNSLAKLDLGETGVTDISAMRDLKGLTTLGLVNTKVADVSALRELTDLTTLDLVNTDVADISALRELTGLTALDLHLSKVADISVLRELKGLSQLDLAGTKVGDASALRELKSLKILNLAATSVTDISALRELTGLRQLDLRYTKVTDVSPLRDLRSLIALDLRGTGVTDVSALQNQKGLRIQQ